MLVHNALINYPHTISLGLRTICQATTAYPIQIYKYMLSNLMLVLPEIIFVHNVTMLTDNLQSMTNKRHPKFRKRK